MDSGRAYISVIIPNFNRGDLLKETLGSLLLQEFQNWEAIVVDDGSADDSENIANTFIQKDPRFSFYKRDRLPAGAPVCRNIGISHSNGSFLMFLDSDDLLRPFALSQRADMTLRKPGFDFWVFPMLLFRDDPKNAEFLWNIDNGKPDLNRFLVLDAPWQTSGPLWRKEAVLKINGFTEGLACWQDVDFHLKALISGLKGIKLYTLPPDVFYRQHETKSVSQGEISSPAKLLSRKEIFLHHTVSLLPATTPEIKTDLGILGGNIAIGAAKALNSAICLSVIRFALRNGIFSSSTALKLLLIQLFYLLRLNRISSFHRVISRLINKYRQDSNIGKHPFIQSAEHGEDPGK
jgi:glycosyltransferase involved in cell wall biosynthesis